MRVERRQLEPRSCCHNFEWLTVESDTWANVGDDGESRSPSAEEPELRALELLVPFWAISHAVTITVSKASNTEHNSQV